MIHRSFVIATVTLMLLGVAQAAKEPTLPQIIETLQASCKYEVEDLDKLPTEELKKVGTKYKYYQHPSDPKNPQNNKQNFERMYTRFTVSLSTPQVIEYSTLLQNQQLGPQYFGCRVFPVENDKFDIILVYERVKSFEELKSSFETADGKPQMTTYKTLIKLFKKLNEFGYYYNNVNMESIGFSLDNQMMLIEPVFLLKFRGINNSWVRKSQDYVGEYDSPALANKDGSQTPSDDIYSFTLMFFSIYVAPFAEDFVKPEDKKKKTPSKDCYKIKDPECTEFLAKKVGGDFIKLMKSAKIEGWEEYKEDKKPDYEGIFKTIKTNFNTDFCKKIKVSTFLMDVLLFQKLPFNFEQLYKILEFYFSPLLVI